LVERAVTDHHHESLFNSDVHRIRSQSGLPDSSRTRNHGGGPSVRQVNQADDLFVATNANGAERRDRHH
jgi:hypothetical protein